MVVIALVVTEFLGELSVLAVKMNKIDLSRVNYILTRVQIFLSSHRISYSSNTYPEFDQSLYFLMKEFNQWGEYELQYSYALVLGFLPNNFFILKNMRAPVMDWDRESTDEDKLALVGAAITYLKTITCTSVEY